MTRVRRIRYSLQMCAVLAALVGVLAVSAVAHADTANIVVSQNAGGASDAAAGLPRVFTLSGVSSAAARVYVKSRAVGGAPCAATAYGDSGNDLGAGSFYGSAVNGAFTIQEPITWRYGGSAFMFCIWIASSSDSITTPIAVTITFRVPVGTISSTVSPAAPGPNQAATVTVAGASEANQLVFATYRAAGAGATCAATFSDDRNTNDSTTLIDGTAANGAFSIPVPVTWTAAGQYLICLWLADDSSDPSPTAGPQPETVIVEQPPPVVRVSRVETLRCSRLASIGSFFAGTVASVCIRYTFEVAPRAGALVSVGFVSPQHRTVRKVAFTWTAGHKLSFVTARIARATYAHHHGRWRVILLIDGKIVKTSSFRVR